MGCPLAVQSKRCLPLAPISGYGGEIEGAMFMARHEALFSVAVQKLRELQLRPWRHASIDPFEDRTGIIVCGN
jgi:hypothetical protein